MKDFVFIIPVRKGSQRVIDKNIKKFHNTNLLQLKINQIKRIFKKPEILLSTDCKKSVKIGKKNKINIDIRPKKYATSTIPMKEVYKYLASRVKNKYICYVNVTSPLISDKSIKKAYNFFNKNKQKYDSLTTVHIIQEYMWFKGKAINYNPNNHPRSQNLKKIYALNFAFSIVKSNFMKKEGKIFGNKFYPLVLNSPEHFDIDEKSDFILAELIYKNIKKIH